MTTDNKTLADVQPGGRVRLGDSRSTRAATFLRQYLTYLRSSPRQGLRPRWCDVYEALEVAIEALAARQPVGQEPLWCLHVLGMDDVHPAPSKAHAEKAAAWHNEQFKDQAARLGISIEAKVVPWPHSAESHAAGVAEFIPQWLIPQWQLDALEPNAAPPAQAVDLERFRPAVMTALGLSSPYGLERETLNELLDLIDSQAVGNK